MNTFETNIHSMYGEKGEKWLNDLPHIIENLALTYGLSDLIPLKNLSYHYVLSGLQNDAPIILKMGLDQQALKKEAMALKAYRGQGAIKVIEEANNVLILERAIPGASLKSCFPDEDLRGISNVCQLIKRLHRAPIPEIFPLLQDWLKALDHEWNVPSKYLTKARGLRDYLLSTSASPVFLHGDLHHENILQYHDEWVAIDPHGVIGESAYEVAAYIRNPIPNLMKLEDPKSFLKKAHPIFFFSSSSP